MRLRIVLATLLVLLALRPAAAFEPVLMKESFGAGANLGQSCPLSGNTNGTAANYRWFNLCSGYIWLFHRWNYGEAAGVRFGGEENPAIVPGNTVKRAITYFRDIVFGYGNLCQGGNVEVALDADSDSDGCPDQLLATTGCFDPELRWNCIEFNVVIPPNTASLIVRQIKRGTMWEPAFVTDGPYSAECDPVGVPRTFYYGINGSACVPWTGPTGRNDNLLTWIIIDGELPNAASPASWGKVKSLFK
jgi:hypothetical protein